MTNGINLAWMLWGLWYAYWIISARKRIRSTEDSQARREPIIGRLLYMGLMIGGFGLLIWNFPLPFFEKRLLPSSRPWLATGLAIEAAGLAFAIWTRHTLGKNWTGRITTGGSQELIMRGPYRIVRHPIYSGLLFAVLGTAIMIGRVRGLVGLAVLLVGILIKVAREETALREHFGSAYQEYAKQVPGLIPGLG